MGFGTFVLGSFLAQQIVIGAAFTPVKQGQHLPAADSLALEETRATLQDISWKGTLTDSTYPAVYRKSRFVLSPKYFSNFKNKRYVFSMLLGAFHRFLCTLSKTCKFQATKCRNRVFIGITCFLLRAIFSGILHRAHGLRLPMIDHEQKEQLIKGIWMGRFIASTKRLVDRLMEVH